MTFNNFTTFATAVLIFIINPNLSQ